MYTRFSSPYTEDIEEEIFVYMYLCIYLFIIIILERKREWGWGGPWERGRMNPGSSMPDMGAEAGLDVRPLSL